MVARGSGRLSANNPEFYDKACQGAVRLAPASDKETKDMEHVADIHLARTVSPDGMQMLLRTMPIDTKALGEKKAVCVIGDYELGQLPTVQLTCLVRSHAL
jgi:hypothetical protein